MISGVAREDCRPYLKEGDAADKDETHEKYKGSRIHGRRSTFVALTVKYHRPANEQQIRQSRFRVNCPKTRTLAFSGTK